MITSKKESNMNMVYSEAVPGDKGLLFYFENILINILIFTS